MDKNEHLKKLTGTIIFIVWSAIVLSAFYITQRPLVFQVIHGVTVTVWSITLLLILLIDSTGLGYLVLTHIRLQLQPLEKLVLGTGLGLGILGLIGYGLGASGLATTPILAVFLCGILVYIFAFKSHLMIFPDLHSLKNTLRESQANIAFWAPLSISFACLLGFLFALLPPADGFDGLFYHLRLPELLLTDRHILPYNIPQFWFPSLLEGNFLWALGLGSEQTAQLIHWLFSILVLILTWNWAHQVFGHKCAWWSLVVLVSMPSFTWLSAWAYTDMALSFFSLSCLYTFWRWRETNEGNWLLLGGFFTGMAMGIKYTSFILPFLGVLLIVFYERGLKTRISSIAKYSLSAILVASPWYIRNWLIMGNPFYPFVFGGRYWDAFQANTYNGAGTGIGWDFYEILLVPFTLTFGYRDRNYFDGRLGPLFLLLLPYVLYVIWSKKNLLHREQNALLIINIFFILNYSFWVFSIIQTIHLWQSRLLFPGLIPLAIVLGFTITNLEKLDLPRFRISFVIRTLIILVLTITLLDNSLSLIVRKPIAYVLGLESRKEYFERIQPQYSEALDLVNQTPVDAYVYFMLEPRSYNMPRKVQPDPINNNLLHDFYLYKTAGNIINHWKTSKYTHVLIYKSAIDDPFSEAFKKIQPYLHLVSQNKDYSLYRIKP